jgi:alpha-L-fucosidase
MFDTAQTAYRVTAPEVPYHANQRANIAKAVFDAFRRRDFGIGAYFSKADWHHPDYWSPLWATPDRNNNYDVHKYPEMWKRFVDFTHAQIDELTTQYGRVDLMWLDAGWVNDRPHPDARAHGMEVPWAQDIDMPGLAALAPATSRASCWSTATSAGPTRITARPSRPCPTSRCRTRGKPA